jgi:hypothetical protein
MIELIIGLLTTAVERTCVVENDHVLAVEAQALAEAHDMAGVVIIAWGNSEECSLFVAPDRPPAGMIEDAKSTATELYNWWNSPADEKNERAGSTETTGDREAAPFNQIHPESGTVDEMPLSIDAVRKAEGLIKERDRLASAEWNAIATMDDDHPGSGSVIDAELADEPLQKAIEAFRQRKIDAIDAQLRKLGIKA